MAQCPPPLNTPLQMKYYYMRKYFKPIHPFFNRIIEKHTHFYTKLEHYEMKKRGKMHMCPSLNESSHTSLGEILGAQVVIEVAKTNVLVMIVSMFQP